MRRRVSGAAETVKVVADVGGEKEVTVRQVPLMEIESPRATSLRMEAQFVMWRVLPVEGELVIEAIAVFVRSVGQRDFFGK